MQFGLPLNLGMIEKTVLPASIAVSVCQRDTG